MDREENLIVVKFGGACFEHFDNYEKICGRILSLDSRPIVVASAKKGVTDLLLAEAEKLGSPSGTAACDLLLSTGEMQSAAALIAALNNRGASAVLIRPEDLFITDGVYGNASIFQVNTDVIHKAYEAGHIPVIPGFYGACNGNITTLGRGGSDYTAVAVGVALGAEEVRLYKAEVDGIYDKDPHLHADAMKFKDLTHLEALRIAAEGGKVVQEKSARLAFLSSLRLSVLPAFGEGDGTTVGSECRSSALHLTARKWKRQPMVNLSRIMHTSR